MTDENEGVKLYMLAHRHFHTPGKKYSQCIDTRIRVSCWLYTTEHRVYIYVQVHTVYGVYMVHIDSVVQSSLCVSTSRFKCLYIHVCLANASLHVV